MSEREGSLMKLRIASGFSLVEVMLALGLLAGGLVTTAGLFIHASRQVNSGRTSTEALAVGSTILEDLGSGGFAQTYAVFGYDGTANSYTVDTRTNSYASTWQSVLDDQLFNAYALIELSSLSPGGPAPQMSDTHAIRVVVTVHWDEGQRHRTMRIGTVRM